VRQGAGGGGSPELLAERTSQSGQASTKDRQGARQAFGDLGQHQRSHLEENRRGNCEVCRALRELPRDPFI
jgi:hypothetical protein